MTNDKLQAGVIGSGLIGTQHARSYDEHPGVDLAAVVDLDEDRAREVAERFHAASFGSVPEALDAIDLDLVTVATPESAHLDPTRTVLDRDVDVLLEKPIADTVADAEAIGEAVEASEADLLVGYVCRFDPRYANLKSRIDDGDFGEFLGIQAARIASAESYEAVAEWTNPLYYLSVHDIDMMRWYLDSEVTEVSAIASRGLGDLSTPAVVTATLQFANGAVGTLETGWARPDGYPAAITEEIRLTGTDGYARLELENDDVAVGTDEGYDYVDTSELRGTLTTNLTRETAHFVDCVRSGDSPLVTWRDGLRSLQVANAVLEAIDTGEPVPVPEPGDA
ncbi:Gfo/Idh/MocA family protein [Haloplanus pelagicus]|jgi:predicted dehydrogenase|uniref:Gfo/Idh/MocA family protein n=1 Tax=Haloplanus pelagicus TaxID=2949995 RepID=UPI00203A4843|nr:Gfo/Idh/MocA family oxidoreductase [Haloplanus sp. HW8-1]